MADQNASVWKQKTWKLFPSQYEIEKTAKLKKLKAETAFYENEDRRKAELHAAGLLHMLMQIEKAKIAPHKNKAQSFKNVSDTDSVSTYTSASIVIQKYIDSALKTSSLDIAEVAGELYGHNSSGLPFAKKTVDKKA